jgi:hypothetical protein
LTIDHSQIVPGIPFSRPDILFHVHPESQNHVYDDGRTHCEERCIQEILPDTAGGNPHFIAYGSANAKSVPFNEISQAVHDDAS